MDAPLLISVSWNFHGEPWLCSYEADGNLTIPLVEKELHAHIDKNSILEKDNERIKRELSSVTELHKKVKDNPVKISIPSDYIILCYGLYVIIYIDTKLS